MATSRYIILLQRRIRNPKTRHIVISTRQVVVMSGSEEKARNKGNKIADASKAWYLSDVLKT